MYDTNELSNVIVEALNEIAIKISDHNKLMDEQNELLKQQNEILTTLKNIISIK